MQLLTVKQLSQKLSCSTSYVWSLQKRDPSFPKPLRIGMGGVERIRGTRWVDSDVSNWLLTKKQLNHNEVQHEDGRSGTEIHSAADKEVTA